MNYDFIEIGLPDFDTINNKTDGRGLFVEPTKFYFTTLDNKKSKINLLYIDIQDVEKYKLPEWFKYYNSVKKSHPLVDKILKEKNLLHIQKKIKVKTITWDKILEKFNITSLDLLKVNGGGNEIQIINSILGSNKNLLPKKIFIRINPLINKDEFELISLKLKKRGYQSVNNTEVGVEFILKNTLPDKIIFSSDDSQYLNFWKINSEICSKILNVTPVLLHITDEDSEMRWDEFGIIKKIKKFNENTIPTTKIIRLVSGIFFPKDKLLISDIDMFLFDKNFLKKSLEHHHLHDVTIIGSDAYDVTRKECYDFENNYRRFPMCYVCLNGEVLNSIMDFNEENWKESIHKYIMINHVSSDEKLFSEKLLSKKFRVNLVPRGYKSNYYISNRIERNMFGVDEWFKLNLIEMENLDGFVDCHCPNFDQYQNEIIHIKNLILSNI